MGKLTKYSKKIYDAFLIGQGLHKINKAFWEKVDVKLGAFFRWTLKITTKVQPNKVMFATQELKFCCNPKYISEELHRQCNDDEVDIIWRAPGHGRGGIPAKYKVVNFNSANYFRELYSCKIIVCNSFLFRGIPVKLKKNQILIQTWHGSLGIKKHNHEAIKSDSLKNGLIKTAKMTDYCVSNSTLENDSFRTSYWTKTPIFMYGHARNDLFFSQYELQRDELRKQIFERYDVNPGTKIVMYAPTFRDGNAFSTYCMDYMRVLETIKEKFNGEWCMFIRFHPALAAEYAKFSDSIFVPGKIIDVTKHPDMQELIASTDVAITDYSSWIYDFVLMRKPGFIYASDLDNYAENERGFFYPIETTPFSISKNDEELCKDIRQFDYCQYQEDVEAFLVDKGCVDDGHASERVAKLIKELIEGKKPTDYV